MIHHVFANRSNLGDWLSAQGIQALLGARDVVEHLCDEPFVPDTLKRLHAAGPDDLIVIGGGGLFMDYFVPFWEGFLSIAVRVPFCIWGVGVCDAVSRPTCAPAALLEEVVRRSCCCVVRDDLTRRLLRRCDLQDAVPCPSIVTLSSMPLGRGLLHVDHLDVVGPVAYDVLVTAGRQYAAMTGRPYRQTNNRIRSGNASDLRATLDLYAQSDLVLSARLHGCVISVAMGRKVLAISADRKVRSFMEAAGLGQWVCDPRDIDTLIDRLATLSSQAPPTEFVEHARRANHAVAEQLTAIAAVLGHRPSFS